MLALSCALELAFNQRKSDSCVCFVGGLQTKQSSFSFNTVNKKNHLLSSFMVHPPSPETNKNSPAFSLAFIPKKEMLSSTFCLRSIYRFYWERYQTMEGSLSGNYGLGASLNMIRRKKKCVCVCVAERMFLNICANIALHRYTYIVYTIRYQLFFA